VAGAAARRARGFAERLARAARLPLVLLDEALTSSEAARRLAEAGVAARARRGRVDAVAGPILLQEALDRGLAVAPGPVGSPGGAEAGAARTGSEEP
jgi:putative Holliday junction resolvase